MWKFLSLVFFSMLTKNALGSDLNNYYRYMSLAGDVTSFEETTFDGVKHILKISGDSAIPTKVDDIGDFSVLSIFFIPSKPSQKVTEWDMKDGVILKVEKKTIVNGASYFHFAIFDKKISENPILKYVYSKNRGVILYEEMMSGPQGNLYKTYVPVGAKGIGFKE
ncbi:hypothetical protein [Lacimicrobium alkaliphilum]|uniref:Uncharacterized protein n=1 Tax=Lacimicrobium alkaliphilum TaxID=1526571 RepID=A0A0U3B1C3_9ALTE|nr:hypothetical protein [Lacimicrobium alkaliphilum]ALT00208.1 hypothetical protein AT746_19340 [Lacimicrobium alkaliphilum]